MDLVFEPGPAVGLVSVAPRAVQGHMPACVRIVDPWTAHLVCELASRIGPARSPEDLARRLDVLIAEAQHRVQCGATATHVPRQQ